MLGKLLPQRLKASLRDEFAWLVKSTLHKGMPLHQGFLPHRPESPHYFIPKNPEKGEYLDSSSLPVPPQDLRGAYGESYLAAGKQDVQTMRQIIAQSGTPIEASQRILDFGCAAGRMIRWLVDEARVGEVWGTDIDSSRITWCKQYLHPPFHFATTTVYPHLPFEDRFFDLIYAGSIFTHIGELADAWFLELRRVLRPGGRLYITIHDHHTIALLKDKYRDHAFAQAMHSCPEFQQWSTSNFGMFTLTRVMDPEVFYDVEFLRMQLEPIFRFVSHTKEAYGYQSAVLLAKT
jgi:ubiquinone/menaquinone biosynthesis C-methylase UbiE